MSGPRARITNVSREEAEKLARSTLSARAVCLWGAGAVLAPTLALVAFMLLAPFCETRAVVRQYAEGRVNSYSAVSSMGGSRKAAERLSAYLRAPACFAPDREKATVLLASCGADPVRR